MVSGLLNQYWPFSPLNLKIKSVATWESELHCSIQRNHQASVKVGQAVCA